MTAARFYSSTAGAMELQSDITSSATSMTVDTVTGLPGTTPFTLVIDVGSSTEEILDVTGVAGTTLTISRGVDGSPAQAHLAGAAIRHMATARDFRDAQEHIGFSSNVHGLTGGASVVGTTSVQVLTNKTATAGSAATVGLYVKGAAAQTAPYMDVQDSGGTSVVTVVPGQDTLKVAGTTGINNNSSAALYHYVAKFTATDASAVAMILKAAAGQTADLFQVQNSAGTVLAKFDSAGKLTAPQVTSTGPVSGTSATFTGQVQSNSVNVVTLSEAQTLTNKTLTAPATTGLTGDTVNLTGAATVGSVASTGGVAATTGTFSGNVTAPNLPASTAAKAGKRLHGLKVNVTPNATGYANVTHGCGFTPTIVVGTSEQAYAVGVDPTNINGTTFQVRLLNPITDVAVTTATDVMFICWE